MNPESDLICLLICYGVVYLYNAVTSAPGDVCGHNVDKSVATVGQLVPTALHAS